MAPANKKKKPSISEILSGVDLGAGNFPKPSKMKTVEAEKQEVIPAPKPVVSKSRPVEPKPELETPKEVLPQSQSVSVSVYPFDLDMIRVIEDTIRDTGNKGTSSKAIHVALRILSENRHLITENRVATIV